MDGRRIVAAACAMVVALTTSAALVACGGAGGSSPSPSIKTFTEAANGQTVQAAPGDEFRVTLKENPTTGYRWDMTLGPGLTLVSGAFTGPSPSPSPPLGAGGTRTWLVRVDTAGTLTLTGVYARPWEAASKSAAGFSLTIDAK